MSAPNLTDIEIMVLGAKVDAELAHPDHLTRTHGTISCYNRAGCRGPLCRYARRIYQQNDETQSPHPKELEDYLAKRLEQHHADHQERLANQRRA